MKNIISLSVLTGLLLHFALSNAQQNDTVHPSKWSHSLAAGFYFIPDNFVVMPVYRADKDWLHLEARYNYESRQALSAWFGYNFYGGNKFQYFITPMVGGIIGNTYGIAPGLEINFDFYGFNFYSESEYVFDFNGKEEYFYYNWTDFTFSPLDWMWFGISIQRTKLFETDLEIQRGLQLGFAYRWFSISGYVFNLGWDQPYGVLVLSVNYPE